MLFPKSIINNVNHISETRVQIGAQSLRGLFKQPEDLAGIFELLYDRIVNTVKADASTD